MRRRVTQILISLFALLFLGDAVNVDILLADALVNLCGRPTNGIVREEIRGSNHSGVGTSAHSIASLDTIAQDEDSPTVVDTDTRRVRLATITEADAPVCFEGRVVSPSFLSLCTLLI
jgi:hypothetical protein